MTTRETLPAILERLVAQLWLTAGAILLVRALLPAPEASPGVKRMPPAWCQALSTVTGTACRWTDDETTLLAPDPRQVETAHYLVRPFGASACTVRPTPSNTPEAALLEQCGQDRPASFAGISSCDLPADSKQLYALAAHQLDACSTVLGGPYDDSGNVLGGSVVPPMLTLFPSLAISTALLDFIDLRKLLDSDFLPLDRLEGRAFSGWLVLPLQQLDIQADDMPRALHLLAHAARAIGPTPFPSPVLLDLAGLSTCPSAKALPDVLLSLDGIGVAPMGHRRTSPDQNSIAFVNLSHNGQPVARLLSLRVTSATTPCTTLNSVPPMGVPPLVASLIEADEDIALPTILLLHFPDTTLSETARRDLMTALDKLPKPLVVSTFGTNSAGELRVAHNGPRIMDMGSLIHEDSLLPAATQPNGWVVQCYQPLPGSLTCIPRLVAGYFGDLLPVATGSCNACQFLPSTTDLLL